MGSKRKSYDNKSRGYSAAGQLPFTFKTCKSGMVSFLPLLKISSLLTVVIFDTEVVPRTTSVPSMIRLLNMVDADPPMI
jgi:hypothetical protein